MAKITAELRAHPDVLQVRLAIYAQARKWDMCVDIAGTTIKPAPDSPVYRILPMSRIRFTGLVVFGGSLRPIRFLRLWGHETIRTTGLSLTPNA